MALSENHRPHQVIFTEEKRANRSIGKIFPIGQCDRENH
jgi:hypothetical protein